MIYDKYPIREGFILFKQQLEECQTVLRTMNSLSQILVLQKNILFLLDLCRKQSLYIIEKTNINVALSSCSNSIMNVKSEYLDDPRSSIIKQEMENIDRCLEDAIASVALKCNSIKETTVDEERVKETVERLEDYRASAELIQTYKDSIKDLTAKSGDETLYDSINKRIEKETRRVEKTLEAGLTFMTGSIAVNSYIKPFDLRGMDYSVLKIPGIAFNHARRETITPIYVFHGQKLAVINVRKKKLSIRGRSFMNADDVFEETLQKVERSTPLVNQTKRFHTPYLMSLMFKNARFLWFSEDIETFKNIKEGTVKLLW